MLLFHIIFTCLSLFCFRKESSDSEQFSGDEEETSGSDSAR
jgi:hypothetical protein